MEPPWALGLGPSPGKLQAPQRWECCPQGKPCPCLSYCCWCHGNQTVSGLPPAQAHHASWPLVLSHSWPALDPDARNSPDPHAFCRDPTSMGSSELWAHVARSRSCPGPVQNQQPDPPGRHIQLSLCFLHGVKERPQASGPGQNQRMGLGHPGPRYHHLITHPKLTRSVGCQDGRAPAP